MSEYRGVDVVVCVGPGGGDGEDLALAAGVAVARRLVDEATRGQVVAVGWGPRRGCPGVRDALALGADRGVLVESGRPGGEGSRQLEGLIPVIRALSPDVVVAARGTAFRELAESLGLRCVADVRDVVGVLDGSLRLLAGRGPGAKEVTCPLPAMVVLTPAAAAILGMRRRPTFADLLAARAKPLERCPSEPESGHSGPNPPTRSPRQKWSDDQGDGHEAVIARLEEMGLLPSAGRPADGDPPPLAHAGVVVAGGRGLGDAGAFAMVEELARLLGGAPAASGGAVASGWAPRTWLVGQTAVTVRPDLYLAFGISGASQHLAGIGRAGHVIAVTGDATSPILALADLGVIGDPRRILSLLLGRLGGGPVAG